ncbi:MAG: hypothetical protein EAZ09_09010 [Oscillatoriales cyanobacterium]|nr:MAG: hypothetical protein EAZ18_24570 [Oscillatoriales cyanobacterium]TAH23011.1 MAG: hypothetical protein EAZ09_09010 [Oscillatoriales cyanobacterium]
MEENFMLLGELAKRLSYKPGYSFLIRRIDNEKALISLRCPSLPHSQEQGEEVGLTINNTVKLSAIVTPSDGLHAFANLVASLELHESAEWFKIDDRQVFLPHGWGDEFGGFKWEDFMNLSGKFLSALKKFIEPPTM